MTANNPYLKVSEFSMQPDPDDDGITIFKIVYTNEVDEHILDGRNVHNTVEAVMKYGTTYIPNLLTGMFYYIPAPIELKMINGELTPVVHGAEGSGTTTEIWEIVTASDLQKFYKWR